MIEIPSDLTIIKAWSELNKINNDINLLETLIATSTGISASKLKEVLVQCSTTDNSKFINSIITKDKNTKTLQSKYAAKNAYENYIYNELERTKVTDIALCISFQKDYQRKNWKEIAKFMDYSDRQVRRIYYDNRDKINLLKNE